MRDWEVKQYLEVGCGSPWGEYSLASLIPEFLGELTTPQRREGVG